jgi:hypothetical protein
LGESTLIDKTESISFLKNKIQEALGKQQIDARLLLRGKRDGKSSSVFHSLTNDKGPLLVIIKTRKNILCGGFSSIDWKSSGGRTVDKKCFIFSLKTQKIYKPQNEIENLYFNQSYGPWFGTNASIGIYNNKLHSVCNQNSFLVPTNA